MNDQQNGNRQRDVMTLRVLGSFFAIMGVLVLIGTYKAVGNPAAMVVNIASGVVLGIIGIGMIQISRRMSRQDPDA